MHRSLFAALLVVALAFGACSKNSSINSPSVADGGSSLTLSKAQEGELADILLLGEDPASIMTLSNSSNLAVFLCSVAPSLGRDGHGNARQFVDIAAIMYYRAALMADSSITAAQKAAIKAAIDSSTSIRAAIFADTTQSSAVRAAALKAEHDRLMAVISGSSGILTASQVANTAALLAQIEAERQLRHTEMLEKRITALLTRWDATLTFTDAQKTQIADLLRAQDADIQAARAQYQYDPEGFRTAALAIQTATQASIRALLDAAQQALWDQMIASGWSGWTDGGKHGGMGGHGDRGGHGGHGGGRHG
jgi:hypothetical protein